MASPIDNTIFVDIDGTLLTKRGQVIKPIKLWIERMHAAGRPIVLWSARGRKYANAVATRLAISHLFIAIIGKPALILDDAGRLWVRYTRVVTPSQICSANLSQI